ncbi:hypothetical protein SNE40_016894 [Patella caerulea]|uniref:IgGFc-binding protein N-terminal domain-containing protein n=1 Tax=Patella caerulea TaxID=87958 RepID=A0AAN8J9D8_PATCE
MDTIKGGENSTIEIIIGAESSSIQQTSGYVTTPLINNDNPSTYFSVTRTRGITLSFDGSLKLSGTGMQFKTFLVTAPNALTVVGLNREQPSTDAFLALEISNLGNDYFAVTHAWANGECHVSCQIAVVAIHNSTVINISLPMFVNLTINGTLYTRSETVVIYLDQYQTYEIQSKYDLTGTRIRSNEPVAVFSGNKKTRFRKGSKDHLVEQLIPVESLGRSFTVIPSPNQFELGITYFKVIATVSNTQVHYASLGTSEQHILVESGDWFEVEGVFDQYYYVTSTKPIMVTAMLFYSRSAKPPTDPCLTVIIPEEQWLSSYSYVASERYTNYFIVIIEGYARENLLLNDNIVSNVSWNQVWDTTLVGGFFQMTPDTNHLTHQFPNVTFGVYVYGSRHVETYCSPAGANLDPAKVQDTTTSNSSIQIQDEASSQSTGTGGDSMEATLPTADFTLWDSSSVTILEGSSTAFTTASALIQTSILETFLPTSTGVTLNSEIDINLEQLLTSSIDATQKSPESDHVSVDTALVSESPTHQTELLTPSLESSSVGQALSNSVTSTQTHSFLKTLTPSPMCPCRCRDSMINISETSARIASIKKELYVDKRTVSATIRKKISAADSRPSSSAIGIVGVVFIITGLGMVILLDIPKIVRDFRMMRGNLDETAE